jgi:hypothetical protein
MDNFDTNIQLMIQILLIFKSETCNLNLTTGILSFDYFLSGDIKQTEVWTALWGSAKRP